MITVLMVKTSKMIVKAGAAQKIPLKKIHSFSTLDESARLVVFRIHQMGQPERIMIDEGNPD